MKGASVANKLSRGFWVVVLCAGYLLRGLMRLGFAAAALVMLSLAGMILLFKGAGRLLFGRRPPPLQTLGALALAVMLGGCASIQQSPDGEFSYRSFHPLRQANVAITPLPNGQVLYEASTDTSAQAEPIIKNFNSLLLGIAAGAGTVASGGSTTAAGAIGAGTWAGLDYVRELLGLGDVPATNGPPAATNLPPVAPTPPAPTPPAPPAADLGSDGGISRRGAEPAEAEAAGADGAVDAALDEMEDGR